MKTFNKVPIGRHSLTAGFGSGPVLVVVGLLFLECGCGQRHDSAISGRGAKDGLPRTLAELNSWYVEPAVGQNAASFDLQGFAAMQIANLDGSGLPLLGKGTLPPFGAPIPGPMKSALTAVLYSNRDALQLFAAGATHEASRYPLDLTRGIDAVFPHGAGVRSGTRLMVLSALLHADAQEGEQAAQDVLTALGLVRSLANEPALISQHVRAGSVSVALTGLEQTLNRTSLTPATLTSLSTVLHKMEESDARGESFNRALTAEGVISGAVLATPQKLLELVPPPGNDLPAEEREQIVARLQTARNLKPEQQYFQDTIQKLMTFRQMPLPDRLKAGDFIRQRASRAADEKLAIMSWMVRGLAAHVSKEATALASLRLGWTAVALEQFRASHSNRYPEALSDLSPDFLPSTPEDPFDGQPLRYRNRSGGYVLYSIGPDLKDDAGERLKDKSGDIVFAVVTPPTLAK